MSDSIRTGLAALVASAALVANPVGAGLSYVVSQTQLIGGAGMTDLVVDPQGNSIVAGVIGSYNLPGVDSAAVANAGYGLRYVAKFGPHGGVPAFIAVVGAPSGSPPYAPGTTRSTHAAAGLALDRNGFAWLVAHDGLRDYPLAGGPYQVSTNKYVFRVSPTGQVLRYSIALDPAIRRVGAIAVDTAGNIYLTGSAGAGLVTTALAPYPTGSVATGCISPYVIKLDPSGQSVVYATYLGYAGTQGERCGNDFDDGRIDPTGLAIAIDAAGQAHVTGQAEPGVRATPGAIDAGSKQASSFFGKGSATHAFVTKLNPAGTGIVYSARLGGSNHESGTGIAVDASGAVYVAGKTSSADFPATPGTGLNRALPVWACPPPVPFSPELGFIAKLSANGAQIVYSGFLPGHGGQFDQCRGSGISAPVKLALDASGGVVLTGYTDPSDRIVTLSANAIQKYAGDRFFAQVSAAGQLGYLTFLTGRGGPNAIALDPWGNVRIAGGGGVQQLGPGVAPIDLAVGPDPVCADAPIPITAQVAGANGQGTVEFFVDGSTGGSAPIAGTSAARSLPIAPGARRIHAIYRGPGPFDGHSSPTIFIAVNQPGTCP